MKKFVFSLETLLSVRKEKERQVQSELIEAEGKKRIVEERIVALQEKGRQAESEMKQTKQRTFSVQELRENLDYLDSIRSQVERMQDDLLRVCNVVASCKTALAEAMKERKALDRLKEKQYEAWETQCRQEERKIADEHATTRFLRQKNM